MRILVHDYAGHPFQAELSRWLARHGGHSVLHLYSRDIETPRGQVTRQAEAPDDFEIEGLSVGRPLDKYGLLRRFLQEEAYAKLLGERLKAFAPDVVLAANTPPFVLRRILKATRKTGGAFVSWVQDIHSIAAARVLANRNPLLSQPALWLLRHVEYGTLRRSDGLVVISPDFVRELERGIVEHPNLAVIENWASATELAAGRKPNPWSDAAGLSGKFVFLYAGTLGLKHNPSLLVDLAAAFADDPSVVIAVVSQGPGRVYLEERKRERQLPNLVLFDFQPYECFSDVMASADVSIVLLEPFAGTMSVPSKVYSYVSRSARFSARSPENLAHRLVEQEGLGVCVDATDAEAFATAAVSLRHDPERRERYADCQRRYAEKAFAIDRIGRRFSEVLDAAVRRAQARR